MSTKKFIQGNQAIAEAAIYSGLKVFAGYPITPSSEIAEKCSELLMEKGGFYIQMEDELASMAAIIGASLSGSKAMTATSGPGFSLMQENLGMGQMVEVPCVIVNVQRSGPSTGLATKPAQADLMQVRWGRHGDQSIIAITPSTVKECFDLTVKAFNLSERFRTPVVLLPDEITAHMREMIEVPDEGEIEVINRKQPDCSPEEYLPFKADEKDDIAPLPAYGSDYVFHVSSSMHTDDGYTCEKSEVAERVIKRLHDKFYNHLEELEDYKLFKNEDYDLLIVTFGTTTRAARAAMEKANLEGKKVAVLQLRIVWPLPEKAIYELAKKAKKVLVPEMNLGMLSLEVERAVKGMCPVYGLHKSNGLGITPKEIYEKIKEIY